MKIKHTISTLVAVASLGVIVLVSVLLLGFNRRQQLEKEREVLATQEQLDQQYKLLEKQVGQWFLTCDLLLSNQETYMLDASAKQSLEVVAKLDYLGQFSTGEAGTRISNCQSSVREISNLIALAGKAIGRQENAELQKLTRTIDDRSEQLLLTLELVAKDVATGAKQVPAKRSALDAEDQRIIIASGLLILIFLMILLSVWRWAVVTLVRPVEALTIASEKASKSGHLEDADATGPEEVQALSGSIHRFVQTLKSQQEELLARETQFRHLMEHAADSFFLHEESGKITRVNKQAMQSLGYSEEELCQKSMQDFDCHKFRVDFHRLAETLEIGEGLTRESQYTDSSGRLFPVETSCSIISRDKNVLFLTVSRDITERKRVESELTDAKNAAEMASRAKSNFLAVMSHEIRTPMNGILGTSELLLQTSLNSVQQRYATIGKESTLKLLHLVNDILDFSKIEVGRLELTNSSFDFLQLMEDSLDLLSAEAATKNVELIVLYPPDMPRAFLGDMKRLRQVLVNLVGNGIKFTESGHVLIRVKKVEATVKSVSLEISVEDTGIGIDAVHLEHIFDRFSQIDDSSTRRFEGTGLGLAISRQLIQLMGGKLTVESELGKGSVFTIQLSLPLSEINSEREMRTIQQSVKLPNRVLVVDDNEVNCQVLEGILGHWGIDVRCVRSGEAALVAIRQSFKESTPFDLALIDYHMPNMDGEKLVKRIRQNADWDSLPLIMLSSSDQSAELSARLAEQVHSQLLKPIKQDELLNEIIELSRKTDSRESEKARPFGSHSEGLREEVDEDKIKVLLVEDNVNNQEITTLMLGQLNCMVEIANNGREGVDKLIDGVYDLVFMDCRMPVLDGLGATREIRALKSEKSEVVVIALTANAGLADKEACLECGMNDFVSKPMSMIDLEEVLKAWCGEKFETNSDLTERPGDTSEP